ncbi:flagellar hook protein FlgE [Symbiobacterium terraclitae]|uniref:Flagellar hook protein FlgE n=1 Tax=Symbiobacterium terraclitae TaxID=557451 RepID=A0ABS4JPV0_9FIRM|nr:flagellar hook protein FlgE [Symbiobacterium terraclitae]MBP2017001.1 flagellar hook protein FlgE [Symbiobacterium terraclitae]
MRSLFSGVSGIRAHQTRMDVIGNNIANVNTVGFKASRTTFTDVFSQTISPGSALANPQQIGLGVGVGSIDLLTDYGSFQMTGRSLDLAISGNGLFVMKNANNEILYSRVGTFDWNADGYLFCPPLGMKVMGWMADAEGRIGRTDQATMSEIKLTVGDVSLPAATQNATFKGNLDAAAQVDDSYITTMTAYDSLGRPISVAIRFTKTDDGWTVEYQHDYSDWVDNTDPSKGKQWTRAQFSSADTTLRFNTDGTLAIDPDNEESFLAELEIIDPDGAAAPLQIRVDFSKVTQAYDASAGPGASKSSVQIDTMDGRGMGTLAAVHVNEQGLIIGRYTNGTTKVLAQIALANFNNMAGLLKEGASTFSETPASGVPQIGTPGSGGRGTLVPGNLEGSNVDLAQQFTEMILTQRGYQASAKLVSTADDMLQEIINLRR